MVLLFSFYPSPFAFITTCEPAPLAVYLLSFICASAANGSIITARFIKPHNEVRVTVNTISDTRKGKIRGE